MGTFYSVISMALLSVAIILSLKKRSGEFAVLISVVCVACLATMMLQAVRPVLDMFSKLQNMTGLSDDVMGPVFKTALIGVLSSICSSICADSGEKSIGNMVEFCGAIMAMYLATPLISAVLELLDKLVGG